LHFLEYQHRVTWDDLRRSFGLKVLKKALILATLELSALLVGLSIVGAFMGAERARELFNSTPLAIYWMVFTFLLLIGLFSFRKLLRSPGALAIHLGMVLILIGAMAGSLRGHELAAENFGRQRIPSGYMRIFEDSESRTVSDETGQAIGELPFRLRLEDFWLEYYDDGEPWQFLLDAPVRSGERSRLTVALDPSATGAQELPGLGATLEVLRFLPSARPASTGGTRTLQIIGQDGERHTVPAEVGREVQLASPAATVKIVQVFNHLQVREGGVVDVPGLNQNPAVKVLIRRPEGEDEHRYAFAAGMMGHGSEEDEIQLTYLARGATGAEADPSTGLPALEVLVRQADGRETRSWLVVQDSERPAVLPLEGPAAASPRDAHGSHGAFLVLTRRTGQVRDYKSRIVVHDGDRPGTSQIIEVNDPLHYGGYHFYQHSYDSEGGRYTILSVRSDTGLTTVYLGFFLVCAGVIWIFWVRPGLNYLKGAKSSGA
jgi:hypothetical protein